MGLKILSNAKVKKPVDCSHHSPEYSRVMGGSKLPLWHVPSLRCSESWSSERSFFASGACPEPLASEQWLWVIDVGSFPRISLSGEGFWNLKALSIHSLAKCPCPSLDLWLVVPSHKFISQQKSSNIPLFLGSLESADAIPLAFGPSSPSIPSEDSQVRQYFPETWLWDLLPIG